MADREKVIDGLKHCMNGFGCFGCPYSVADKSSPDCQLKNGRDALELLKEQEDKIRQLRLALQIMNGNGIKVDTEGR